ncbi:ROK family protein [Staphylococcus aureus]|uniref:ROK family protein n=1 Tax=Staphylococcus aureus TaxID=1280 RepID=UPI0012FE5863
MEAARQNDRIAEMAVEDLGYWLGIGLATVADVFDPDLIVVGGGVGSAGDLFLSHAREVYAQHVTLHARRRLSGPSRRCSCPSSPFCQACSLRSSSLKLPA